MYIELLSGVIPMLSDLFVPILGNKIKIQKTPVTAEQYRPGFQMHPSQLNQGSTNKYVTNVSATEAKKFAGTMNARLPKLPELLTLLSIKHEVDEFFPYRKGKISAEWLDCKPDYFGDSSKNHCIAITSVAEFGKTNCAHGSIPDRGMDFVTFRLVQEHSSTNL